MPVTMKPPQRLVLSWDMFTPVPAIGARDGQSMNAETTCRFNVDFHGSHVTVTVSPDPPAEAPLTSDGLKVRIGAQQTAELLKHEQGHADIVFLAGLAAGNAIARRQSGYQATIARHEALGAQLQRRYDQQTGHGANKAQQDRWNRLLDTAITLGQTTVDGTAL